MEATPAVVTCRTHRATAVNTWCARCVGPFCNVCLFDTPVGAYCADCMTRPSAEQQSAATSRGVLSVLGAAIAVVSLGYVMSAAAVPGEELSDAASNALYLF